MIFNLTVLKNRILKKKKYWASQGNLSNDVGIMQMKKSFCPQQVVFRKAAVYKCKLADYSKVVVYKCKLVDYSKAAVYKCKLVDYSKVAVY